MDLKSPIAKKIEAETLKQFRVTHTRTWFKDSRLPDPTSLTMREETAVNGMLDRQLTDTGRQRTDSTVVFARDKQDAWAQFNTARGTSYGPHSEGVKIEQIAG